MANTFLGFISVLSRDELARDPNSVLKHLNCGRGRYSCMGAIACCTQLCHDLRGFLHTLPKYDAHHLHFV